MSASMSSCGDSDIISSRLEKHCVDPKFAQCITVLRSSKGEHRQPTTQTGAIREGVQEPAEHFMTRAGWGETTILNKAAADYMPVGVMEIHTLTTNKCEVACITPSEDSPTSLRTDLYCRT